MFSIHLSLCHEDTMEPTIEPPDKPRMEPTTNATAQAKLIANDGSAFDEFGYSVVIFDGTGTVGAPEGDNDNGDNSGSAYIFVRDGASNWIDQAKLIAND